MKFGMIKSEWEGMPETERTAVARFARLIQAITEQGCRCPAVLTIKIALRAAGRPLAPVAAQFAIPGADGREGIVVVRFDEGN